MKRLLLASLFLLVTSVPAFGLIVTDNVDRDDFQYEVGYSFATEDLTASLSAIEIPARHADTISNFYYVVPRDGRIVGMSVAGNAAVTDGAATFDITINSQVTGVQTVIENTVTTARSAVGIGGSAGSQYAYIRQDRAETAVFQGFRAETSTADRHNADHPYGKATALSAGNRVGVKVTTSSGLTPTSVDYLIVIYVLE